MAEKKTAAPEEHEALILVSPGGHKYEFTVSDSGILNVKYVKKEKEEK